MKIRMAFVTNSSSVSYIVSWSPDMAEFIRLKSGHYEGDPKKNRIYSVLTEDLREHGKKEEIEGNTVYSKKYGFMKKTECLYDDSFGKPIEEVDFETLDEPQLWAYIWGEYLVNARLAREMKGFGAVQVPRDPEAFKQKFCGKIICKECPRQGTPQCFKKNNG
ncbi:MAG: hypothetical protein M0P13_09110 [Fibrobacteraceae bacterium]|nr:hypothetical protein [Fibrobacteraceae bacterium]